METKFNFKSQICTTIEQSERLIALGIKKETADCGIYYSELAGCDRMFAKIETEFEADEIPAWSLHRLIEMTKLKVTLFLYGVKISHPQWERAFVKHANVWDNLCDCIEWLIKEGYFPKEYLV